MPADKARKLAKILGVTDPATLSSGYAAVAEHEPGNVAVLPKQDGAQGPLRPDLVIARLENDVDALRYAVAALVSTMTIHRPAEAADAARVLRRSVPARFRESGLIPELAATLERALK